MHPAASDRPRPLIFMHIPKAAGTTMTVILNEQYARLRRKTFSGDPDEVRAFAASPAAERDRYDVLMGHVRYGLHLYLERPAVYITMLRDPVERILSYYYYAFSEPKHYLYSRLNSEGVTLRALVERPWTTEVDNDQVRWFVALDPRLVRAGCVTRAMLDEAKYVLEHRVAAFGLAERFEDSLRLFKHALGWRDVAYESRNVNRQRPARDAVPAETLALIRERNALDVELHRFATALFERRLAEAGLAEPRAASPAAAR